MACRKGMPPLTILSELNDANWVKDRGLGLFEKPWFDRFCALLPPVAHNAVALGTKSTHVPAKFRSCSQYRS
jgi:hypothetical protein